MERRHFNLKSYQALCQYLRDMPGRMHLLCGTGRRDQISVGYIEDRISELELDLVIVDPIYLLKPVRLTADGNTYQETAWIAENLHRIGEQYNIPIVFTNQAHFDSAKSDAPNKEKSFGAKTLVHLSDHVAGIQHMSDENIMRCKCSKSRFGQDFRFDLRFYPNTGVMKPVTPLGGNYFNGSDEVEENEMRQIVNQTIKGKGKTHG
jgi:hypothetical protein